MNALHAAAANGYREIVKNLVHRGANINLFSGRQPNYTPLMHALANNHKEVALFLLQNQAEVGNNEYGTGPLNLTYDKDLVTILLERGADAKGNREFQEAPLAFAVAKGCKDVVRMLIKHGAEVDAPASPYMRCTALHTATWNNNVAAMEALLEEGANIEAHDDTQEENATPLHLAARLVLPAAVRLLLDKKADVNAISHDCSTPLHFAAGASQPGMKLEVVDILVQHGANLKARNAAGQLPLHRAAVAGNAAIVEYLVHRQLSDDPDDSHPANAPSFTGKTRVEILSTLLAMNPHDEICLSILGPASWIEGQSDKAVEALERLLDINPANESVTEAELRHSPTVKCNLGCYEEVVGVYYIYPPSSDSPDSSHLCNQCFTTGSWHEHISGLDDERFVRIPRVGAWPRKVDGTK